MQKGFGYSKYSLTSKMELPFPIPFTSGAITSDSIISMYLLSTRHLISVTKSVSTGVPGSDSFELYVATDVVESTNGTEVKWSYAMVWVKSSMLKPIVDMKLPGEIEKVIKDYCAIADEVALNNKPEVEVKRPDVIERDIEIPNVRNNPVFLKKVEQLNVIAAIDEEEELKPKNAIEIFNENFQFEEAKQRAIRYGEEAALAKGLSESMTSWDLIPKRLKRANPDDPFDPNINGTSFDGVEYLQEVNELDESEIKKAYFILAFMAFSIFSRVFL